MRPPASLDISPPTATEHLALLQHVGVRDDVTSVSTVHGWWYEVDAQREKPTQGSPALEVKLEGEGSWWLTAIRGADAEGREAMSDLVDFLANDD